MDDSNYSLVINVDIMEIEFHKIPLTDLEESIRPSSNVLTILFCNKS